MTGITQKAVIYCRVSDVKQKTEGHGLESQEIRCREYAQRKGFQVVKVFHDDISGKFTGRPALSAMLAFIQDQETRPVVIIDDGTRLARSMRAHLSIRDAITMAGGILHSPTKTYEDDPEEDIQEIIEAAFAGHHRRQNAKQTVNRMRARVTAGYWVFPPPVGYKFANVEGHGKMLVRDEPAASLASGLGGLCFRAISVAGGSYAVPRFKARIPRAPSKASDPRTHE